MNCDHAITNVDAYADGELTGVARWRVQRHLRTCTACAARVEDVRALHARIRLEAPRHAAPAALRARVAALRESAVAAKPPHASGGRPLFWLAGGELAGSALTVVVWLAAAALTSTTDDDIARAAVDAHVRATLGGTLIQVASSDQHTVKPWLSARLDYSPPVRDFAADGYPLAGARIERIRGRDVATLVYRYRLHTVDVVVQPDAMPFDPGAQRAIRGFNVVHARGRDMDWLIVSDASIESLAPLVRDLTAP